MNRVDGLTHTERDGLDLAPLIPSSSPRGQLHTVAIGEVVFGGPAVPVIAGPCSVEHDYVNQIKQVANAGASVLRGSVYKPRTSPKSFQGLGKDGLPLLEEAKRQTKLPVLVEPLAISQVEELVQHADALLIGARSMQNTPLLRAVGQTQHPVILKRAPSGTYEEWLGAAEYIRHEGNHNVILCERGIRTFETTTRNTLDISSITVMRQRTELPIIIDPSHATGNAEWVASLSLAAIAAGADGLLIEVHPEPAQSWSDADQAITPALLRIIVEAVNLLAALTRAQRISSLDECRNSIDVVDDALARLIERRVWLTALTQRHKSQPMGRDVKREQAIVDRVARLTPTLGAKGADQVMRQLIDACMEVAKTLEIPGDDSDAMVG